MIHAARKRRQKARELGHDYIPVEEQRLDCFMQNKLFFISVLFLYFFLYKIKYYSEEKGISRLVREEDNDRSDDEDSQERINMTINTDALDKEKRRQVFLESQASIVKRNT
jgi:hypothetical protein